MKKRTLGIISLICILLSGISFLFDSEISKGFELSRNYFLDYLFVSLAFGGNLIILFFVVTSLFMWQERKRRWILPLWLSSIMSFLVCYFMKILIKRPRPFEVNEIAVLEISFNFIKDNFHTWNFSFPSMHPCLVFATIPILNKEFRRFKYFWIILAFLISLSRVYFGLHYLSDVIAGGIIGYLIGHLIINAELTSKFGENIMKKLGLINY